MEGQKPCPWVRLENRERTDGRKSYWVFNANVKDDEDVPIYRKPDLACVIRNEAKSHLYDAPARSHNEEQLWTVYIPPEDIFGGRAGCRDSLLGVLGLDIAKRCALRGHVDLKVDILYTSFEVRVVDCDIRDERRIDQCRAACMVLLFLHRRRRTTMLGTAFHLVARTLWDVHKKSARWDDVPGWLTAPHRPAQANKRIKV
jgi:hypothetical protein